MRILYHHRTLGDGAEGIHIREMIRAFRAIGHQVKVIGPVGESEPSASTKGGFLQTVKRAIPGVLYECMEIAYSIVAFIGTTWAIWRFRPDFIYDRYITFNAGVVLAGKLNRVPVFLEVNAPLAFERSKEQDERLTFRRLASAMERWICSAATRTIVVSTPLRDYLESLGVARSKCVVMPNGVDPVRFTPRDKQADLAASLGLPSGAFVIGFTGVLRPWHGLDLLLAAMALISRIDPNICLLIVGDGPYRSTIEQMVRDANLSKVAFITGRVGHDRVPDHVALFDVAVSPRATFYASPMKVIEYMALGKAVLVPRTPNFLDMIQDGVDGACFTDGDAQDLGKVLRGLYNARDFRDRLGRSAREKVETRLNWQWNAREVCRLVSTLT